MIMKWERHLVAKEHSSMSIYVSYNTTRTYFHSRLSRLLFCIGLCALYKISSVHVISQEAHRHGKTQDIQQATARLKTQVVLMGGGAPLHWKYSVLLWTQSMRAHTIDRLIQWTSSYKIKVLWLLMCMNRPKASCLQYSIDSLEEDWTTTWS